MGGGTRLTLAWLAMIASAAAISSSVGCQTIAGIEQRPVDPLRDGCTLPASAAQGGAQIRFGNLMPQDGSVDVCVRAAGSEYQRPVLRGGGTACPAGFSYEQISAPFAVPAGHVDVKVVPAGSTCRVPALAEASGVAAAAGSTTTVLAMGTSSGGRQIHAYPDSTLPHDETMRLRFIHAVAGGAPLDFGITVQKRLPAQLATRFLASPLAFAESTRPDTKALAGVIDSGGYLETPKTAVNLAAARAGESNAVLVVEAPPSTELTVIAIGDAANPTFPIRALLCSDHETTTVGNVSLTSCIRSELATISVDMVNAMLYGAFAVEENARRPYLIDAIAARNSDVMCITSLNRASDRQAVVDKAKATGAFPYSLVATTDLDSAPTDPRDQHGNVPPKPTHPSCGGTNDPTAVDAALDCIIQNCSSTHTPAGIFAGASSCLSEKCAPDLIPLLFGDADHQRCMGCIATSTFSYETHADSRALCTTDSRDYKGFRGQTPTIILSKFPISKSDTYILPSSAYARAVLYAQLDLEKDVSVDYYCTELIPALGQAPPDPSAYANGVQGAGAWLEEQKLQAQRVIDFVKSNSGSKPAIISGDWEASKADPAHGIDDQNPAVIDMLEGTGGFALGVPPGYVPRCTECPAAANPYNADERYWQLKTYVSNLPRGADSAELFWTDAPVPLSTGAKGPLTDRWGFNVRIIRP